MLEHNPNIAQASTPDKRLYNDSDLYQKMVEKVFATSWQLVGDTDNCKVPGSVWPQILLEGCLDEPIVFTRDKEDNLHCLSNVCTHRGMMVCENAGNERFLRCRYHGRRFGMDGKFLSMPEFEGVENFPSERDNLPKIAFQKWRRFLFANLFPAQTFEDVFAGVEELCGWMPIEEFWPEPSRTRDYLVRANWALYVDNYLEGFHIPFIHADLNEVIDYGSYEVKPLKHGVLQVAIGKPGESVFDLPAGHPYAGKLVSAFYFWLFPNLMLNFYPWGLSVNVVRPLGVDRTRVSFIGYVWDASKMEEGAGAALDRVEREDEVVVELVHKGLKSRFYDKGRYSVAREQGIHHFHQLLVNSLKN